MNEVIKKLQKREKLTEADFNKILTEQTKQIDNLRKTNFKLANVKANEAINRIMFAQYNYKIECLETRLKELDLNNEIAKSIIKSSQIAVEEAAQKMLKKMEWWK